MPTLVIETFISATSETCFDLIRDKRVHVQTRPQADERAVAAGLGQTVTFESSHFGIKQTLTVKVTEFDRPRLFVDEMVEGTFRSFRHVHEFSPQEGGTMIRDTLSWTSPYGILGRIIDKMLIHPRLRCLVSLRNARLKEIAESTNILIDPA